MGTNILGTHIFQKVDTFGQARGELDYTDMVEHADGFAEVFPEHKFLIVEVRVHTRVRAGRPLRWCRRPEGRGGGGRRGQVEPWTIAFFLIPARVPSFFFGGFRLFRYSKRPAILSE